MCAKTDVVCILSSIVPEHSQLAKQMASNKTLSSDKKLQVLQDLVSLCTQDFEVFYHLGEEPINRACPTARYQLKISK